LPTLRFRPDAGQEARVYSVQVRDPLRPSQGKWSDAGRELDAMEALVKQ
jgi:hypothetical protein